MEIFSALLSICAGNSPVAGEFPAQRPGTRIFDIFFDLRLNKRLSKQRRGCWFEKLLRLLWRHRNVNLMAEVWDVYYAYFFADEDHVITDPYSPLIVSNDVIKWKHFPCYWPFVRGIHRSPVNSPHKGQWCGVLIFSLICAWMNGWVNKREAGDLRRHEAHYNVIVMHFACSHMVGIGNSWIFAWGISVILPLGKVQYSDSEFQSEINVTQ